MNKVDCVGIIITSILLGKRFIFYLIFLANELMCSGTGENELYFKFHHHRFQVWVYAVGVYLMIFFVYA